MKLRKTTAADYNAVAGLLEASYHSAMDELYRPEAVAGMCLPRRELLVSGRYFIVEDEESSDAAVGVGGWSESGPSPDAGGGAQLRHFATLPAYAGRGVARRIIARCEAEARHAAISELRVCASLNAVGFYERCGYRPVRELGLVIEGVDAPAMLMKKVLG